MFASAQPRARRPRLATYCSIAAHGLLLLWLVHPSTPKLIASSFVVNGDHGSQIAHLYWLAPPSQKSDASAGTSSTDSRQQLNTRLTWKRRPKTAKASERELPLPKVGVDDQTSAPAKPFRPALRARPWVPFLKDPYPEKKFAPRFPSSHPIRASLPTNWAVFRET